MTVSSVDCGRNDDNATEASPNVPGDTGGGDPGPKAPDGDATLPDGGSDAGSDVSTSLGAEIDAFDAALASAICGRLSACCAAADRNAFFGQFQSPPYDLKAPPSTTECAATLTAQLGKLHKKWAGSAALGRVTFDASRAKACVASMNGAACGVPLATALYDRACLGTRGNEVFKKVTPLGAACDDIKDGTFFGECDPTKGFCGTSKKCEPWRKTGEDCGFTPTRMFCAPDLSCEGGTPSKPGKCSAAPIMRNLGEPCGAPTGPLELCNAGLYCEESTKKCAATKADGAACQFDDECTTFHPYSCSPFGGGTCGANSYCNTPGAP
ncbi:MAG: hypothetical protein JST00_32320 [Deltaproteobacteria bacterium]|nr:hypothetical protein [Deltaproteobacteria bacterium]